MEHPLQVVVVVEHITMRLLQPQQAVKEEAVRAL
jgi:hypothetical protein